MNYKNYNLEDFLKDEFFIKWVREPNQDSDRFWQQWIANNPQKKQEVLEASQIIKSLRYEHEYQLEEAARNEIISNILGNVRQIQKEQVQQSAFNYTRVAAAITLLLVSGLLFWFINNYNDGNSPEKKLSEQYITKSTIAGQRLTITLSDGSKIKLNTNTEISFPEKFSDSIRLVKVLKGEVFFEVTKNKRKPFVVQTGDIKTKVLGTSFNVDYSKPAQQLNVALVTGKVQVIKGDSIHNLIPTEMLHFEDNKVVKSNFDPLSITGWKDGILVFEKVTFIEAIERLEEWYGVSIEYTKHNDGIYSGVFENENLENVLEGLGFTTNFNYELKNKKVILK
ncbi:MAG: anti-sigma factor [Thalassobius sp.]|nr:anti-sigma factor [Thalassovita sp.]